jgi:hypothetical protein
MNLLFLRKQPAPIRYVIATRTESKAVAAKKRQTTEALRRWVTEQQLHRAVADALGVSAMGERE